MPASEWLCHLLGVNSNKFTIQENCILEAELYRRILYGIWDVCKAKHKDYFSLIQQNFNQEEAVMELHVIRYLINDLIKDKAYTSAGIARYTYIPAEIIENIFMGINMSNILTLPRRLMELHKFEYLDIYENLLKNLISQVDA